MTIEKRPRLAYLSGPVDAANVYDAWAHEGALEYFGTSYLKQFYQTCAEYNSDGYVITTLPGQYYRKRVGAFAIENRPMPSELRGLRYHIAMILWLVKMIPSIIRFRPDIFLLSAGYSYWFPLSMLKLFRITMIPIIHDSLWQRFRPMPVHVRIQQWLSGIFLSSCVSEIMVAAKSTGQQVRSIVWAPNSLQIEVFLPTYPREQFSLVRQPDFASRPFNVLFMGRIEINKGVYDLLEIASPLNPRAFHFDVCGSGPELLNLRRKIEEQGLTPILSCHGFLDRDKLYELLDKAHVIIVPTTTDFEEGFNMVCAEAVLCGRPVITSKVCPALAYITEAAIEVPPNDVERYRKAIVRLSTDQDLYEQKRAACYDLQQQFYDVNNSWSAKLRTIIDKYLV